jgi:hypothetical protein
MAVDHALLKSHWQLMKSATANDLYAGLAFLAMELNDHFYSLVSGDTSIEQFQSLYNTAVPNSQIGRTSANKAKEDRFEFNPELLSDKKSEAYVTRIEEGKNIFLLLAAAYKPTICSTKGVLGILLRGTVNTDELPVIIAIHILNNNLSEAHHWYSFAMVLACLIDEQTVENFCQEN